MGAPDNIDAYIAVFPPEVQEILQKVRATIRRAAPEAGEAISYGIPTFKLNGRYLIYFAGYKQHIAAYPVPNGDAAFNEEAATYQSGKGTLRFPLDKPIPYDFITRAVQFAIEENQKRMSRKKP